MVEMDWWAREGRRFDWPVLLSQANDEQTAQRLKRCTARGVPFGDEEFVNRAAAKKCLSLFQGVVGAGEVEQGGAGLDVDGGNFAKQNRMVPGWMPLERAAVKPGQRSFEPW